MPLTITTSTILPVVTKYGLILDEMFVQDSVYMRTKDTLQELMTSGDLTSADKAKVISEVMGNLNNSLVNASLSTALQWAKDEVTLSLEKEKLGYDAAVLAEQALLTAANTDKTKAEKNVAVAQELLVDAQKTKTDAEKLLIDANKTIATQEELKVKAEVKKITADAASISAQTAVTFGIPSVDANGVVTSVIKSGTKAEKEINLLVQEELNKKAEEDVLKSKLKESQAAVYKIAADAAANYGTGFTVTATGDAINVTGSVDAETLSWYQKEIAKQQAKGYIYSAWSNAVNASATAIATLNAEDDDSGLAGDLQSSLKAGINNLLAASATTEAEPPKPTYSSQ